MYGSIIMTESLREFTWFISLMQNSVKRLYDPPRITGHDAFHCLSLFGHVAVACMDGQADVYQMLFNSLLENCREPQGDCAPPG